MITTLLMYVCIQSTAAGCVSEEVWAERQWEGPVPERRCDTLALELNRRAEATGEPKRYECESTSGENEFSIEPTSWRF